MVRPISACEVNKHSSPGGRLPLHHSFHHLHNSTHFEKVYVTLHTLRTLVVGVTRHKLPHSRFHFIVAAQKWSGHGLTGPTSSYAYATS